MADERAGDGSRTATQVLVGRTREQERLRLALDGVLDGSGRVILIGGEAGIGKTTLARDLSLTARASGFLALTGSCYDLTGIPPYGLWLDLFESCHRDHTLPPPPSAFAEGQLARITDQAALVADVRRFLSRLTDERPAIVILEDVHWADPASLDLLRHIGPYVQHRPLLLLITYRSDELATGRLWPQHLPALIRETEGMRLDLDPLDADALRALMATRYHLEPAGESRLLTYLMRKSEGNPLFANEILRTLESAGVLRKDDQEWVLGAIDHTEVPSLLRQVIDARVARLGEAPRVQLAIASVIGHDVPLDLWQTVADIGEGDLLDLVERSLEAHLLEADRQGTRVRFVHALTREALYEGILPPRRKGWHGRIAEILLARSPTDPDAIAYHLREAGDPRAVDWLIRAGERAQSAYAWLTAAERFQAAVSLLEGREHHQEAQLRLHIRSFYLLRFAYPTSAIAAMDEAIRLAHETGDQFSIPETLALRGLLLCYTDRFRVGLADMEHGIAGIESLPTNVLDAFNTMRSWLSQAFTGQREGVPADDESVLARLQHTRVDYRRSYQAWVVATAGRLTDARSICDRLEPILGDTGHGGGTRLASAFLRHALAILAAADGHSEEAAALWARARRDFEDHHVLVAFTCLDELRDVALTFRTDDPSARRKLAADAAAALERAGGALRPGVTPAIASLRCLEIDGHWHDALHILEDLPTPGNAFLRRETTAVRATIARHTGDHDRAWQQILPLFPQGAATEPGNLIHQEGLSLIRLATDLCLDSGDLAGAGEWLTAHDRWLAWTDCVLGQADGRLAWGRYFLETGDLDDARAVLGQALDRAANPNQPLVRLRAHRLLGSIALADHRTPDAEAHLVTALALATACDAPYERALTELVLAECQLSMNAATRAMELLSSAIATFSALNARPALAWADALTGRLSFSTQNGPPTGGLTPRELDVLRLVAEGHSNPAIASALFISRETARTHVSNILRKLDVGSRTEAVDYAHRHGLLARSERDESTHQA